MLITPAGSATPAGAPAPHRERWIDVAKGIAILLVVLNHANAELHHAGLSSPLWQAVNAALTSIRMPTFFLLSGLFAVRSLTAPWPVFFRVKLARFGWLYAVWVVLFTGPVAVHAALGSEPVVSTVVGWLLMAVVADEALWYLLALPIYFLIARLTRRVSVALQLTTATVPYLLVTLGLLSLGSWGADHIAAYFAFFLTGCHCSTRIRVWVAHAPTWMLTALAAGWLTVGAVVLALPTLEFVLLAVMPLAGVPMALLATRVAAGWAPIERSLGWLGRNTLSIYVLHMAPLLLLVPLMDGWPAGVVWTPVLAACALAASLAVWAMTRRVPGLYELPVKKTSADARP